MARRFNDCLGEQYFVFGFFKKNFVRRLTFSVRFSNFIPVLSMYFEIWMEKK